LLLAFVAGAVLTTAFAPFYLSPLAVISPALLLLLMHGRSPARAALLGFGFGLGLFGSGVSWVYVSIHNFGNMAAPLAVVAVLIFVSILAAYIAGFGWLIALVGSRISTPFLYGMIAPALWVLLEWVRSWLFSGFPWLNLGYSQAGWPLAGLAPWLGVYGISLAVAVSAGLLAWVVRESTNWKPVVLASFVLWSGAWGLGQASFTEPDGNAIDVAVIQNNVPLRQKWGTNRQRVIQGYVEATRTQQDADLVVWPEAAVPVYWYGQEQGLRAELASVLEAGTTVVIGAPEREQSNGKMRAFNSAFIVSGSADNDALQSYRKRHLVPFGEYIPVKPLFDWLLNVLHIPMSDFSPGENGDMRYRVNGHLAAMSICYEDSFGEELIEQLPEAGLIINLSEDAWFGNSLAPHQRVQIARMRVLETGRPLVRAANTGPSLVVNADGTIAARTPQFETAVLRATLQPTRGATPYVVIGNSGVLVLIGAMLIPLAWAKRKY